MKAVFLILVASSAYVNGQHNFFGIFKGYPLKNGQIVKSLQPLEGPVEGQIQIPSNQVPHTVNNVRGVLNGQEVQGQLHSIQIKNPPQIQGQVSSIPDFLVRYGPNNLHPFSNSNNNIQPIPTGNVGSGNSPVFSSPLQPLSYSNNNIQPLPTGNIVSGNIPVLSSPIQPLSYSNNNIQPLPTGNIVSGNIPVLSSPIFSFQPGFIPIALPPALENVETLPVAPTVDVFGFDINNTAVDHHISETEDSTLVSTTQAPSPVVVESDSHVPDPVPEVLVDSIPVDQHTVSEVPTSNVVPETSEDSVVPEAAEETSEEVLLDPHPVSNDISEVPDVPQGLDAETPVTETPVKPDAEWEAFKAQYDKSYDSAVEDAHRKDIYYSNKQKINAFNTNKASVAGFELDMNHFGDLTFVEFNNAVNGFTLNSKAVRKNKTSEYIPSAFVAKPKLVDWRNFTGAVTDVKDQGQCFSCWAFTAAAVLESHWWRKTGVTLDISEQNLLDCRTDGEKDSCAPGFYSDAWEYIRDNNGVDGEDTYPYESYNKDNFTCRFKPEGVVAKVTGIINLEGEAKMELAVATQGPIAAAIDANTITQQFYKFGIYKVVDDGLDATEKCTEDINHAVTIVGFGEEEDGQKYWLIKNSYGAGWGINGYMKLARGVNMCGIALYPAYPLV